MSEFPVHWSRQAAKDVDEIVTFILEKWPGSAVSDFIIRLESAQTKIAQHPYSSPSYDEKRNVRICKIDDHNAFYYRVHLEHVEILRVFPYKRDRTRLDFE